MRKKIPFVPELDGSESQAFPMSLTRSTCAMILLHNKQQPGLTSMQNKHLFLTHTPVVDKGQLIWAELAGLGLGLRVGSRFALCASHPPGHAHCSHGEWKECKGQTQPRKHSS